MNIDKQYILVFPDGSTSQPYLWRDEAHRIAKLTKFIGIPAAFIVGCTPKPRQFIANQYGKKRHR